MKKSELSIHNTIRMKLERKISSWYDSIYTLSWVSKSMEMESRLAVARQWQGKGDEKWQLMKSGVPFACWKCSGTNSGDVCMYECTNATDCTLKNGSDGKFCAMWILPKSLKKTPLLHPLSPPCIRPLSVTQPPPVMTNTSCSFLPWGSVCVGHCFAWPASLRALRMPKVWHACPSSAPAAPALHCRRGFLGVCEGW